MNTPARPFSKPLFTLFVLCSLAAIFYIPYFVPQIPSTSQSWIFGYSNRAGVILVLGSLVIAVLWTRRMNLSIPVPGSSQKVPGKILFATLIAYLCAALLMIHFAGRYGGFGESAYFLDRAWLVEHGKVPYRDFEYCFGLSFLYGPIALEHLLRVSLLSAYHTYWILNLLVSVVLGYAILNRINLPTPDRLSVYLLLFVPGILTVLNMGVNYAGTRFLFPIYFVLVMRKLFEGVTTGRRIRAIFFALVATAFMFLFSAETPFALTFTAVCFYVVYTPKWRRGLVLGCAAMLLAFSALFLALAPTHIFDTIKSDGASANSFPIVPSPPILFYFLILFFCGCYLLRRFEQRILNDDCVALILYSIPLIAAALARCDPGHLSSNGLGFSIASMFWASIHKRIWLRYRVFYLVFMVLLPILTGLAFSKGQLQEAGRMNTSGTDPNRDLDLSQTYPGWSGAFYVPFGFRPNGIGTYLSTRIDYGRFDGLQNLNTVPGVSEVVAHMREHPQEALLLPDRFDDSCQINAAGQKLIISLLLDTVYLRQIAHPVSIRKPICDYIHANYALLQSPNAKDFNHGLWIRTPAEESLPAHSQFTGGK